MALLSKKTLHLGDGLDVAVDPKLKTVTFRMGGKKSVVKKTDLWAACFAIADAKVQEELMPVRKTEMTMFLREHNVKVTRDMKAGEMIKVHCEVSVPQEVEKAMQAEILEGKATTVPAG